jgi:hypothetical protein
MRVAVREALVYADDGVGEQAGSAAMPTAEGAASVRPTSLARA